MARIRVAFDGNGTANGSALLMHNERLADPLDPYAKRLAELSKKTKKTERDYEELGRREFLGAGYWLEDDGQGNCSVPYIPTWNIIRCLQEAGTRHKLGKQVLRGIVPVVEETLLVYVGPESADELWKAGTFHSRKGVGVGQRRVIRTRPCFSDWRVDAELELDLTILDVEVVNLLAVEAGLYIGLGDARPRFGRFRGSAELAGDAAEFALPDLLDEAREKAAATAARRAISERDAKHAGEHPNGRKRGGRVRAALKNGGSS